MMSPMPAPSTSRDSDTSQKLVWESIRDSRNRPTAVTAEPAMGNARYRPVHDEAEHRADAEHCCPRSAPPPSLTAPSAS